MFDLPKVENYRSPTSEAVPSHEVLVLDTVNQSNSGEWNDLVDRVDCATIFHRHEWIAAIEAGYRYGPCHIEVRKDSNLVGVLPQFAMDIPNVPFHQIRSVYPGFGGPLIGTDREETLDRMMSTAADLCSGRRILHEIRGCDPSLLQFNDPLRRAGYRPARFKGRFVLDIDRPYEEILADMDRSRQKGIANGRATDHRIVEDSFDPDSLDRIHEAHTTHMASVGGDPFPRAFFDALEEMRDHVLLHSIYFEEEYAGTFVQLRDPYRDTLHLLIAALPPTYYEYNLSEALHDAAIKWGIDHGIAAYDLGGGGGDFTNGIFRYKAKFGGHLEPNYYWERGFGLAWPIVKAARSIYLQRK